MDNDLFTLFAEPSQQNDIPWTYPSFSIPNEPSNNILFDLGTAFTAYVDPNALVAADPPQIQSALYVICVTKAYGSVPTMSEFFDMMQKRQPDLETLGEMRQFWAELLHFCQFSYWTAADARCQSQR